MVAASGIPFLRESTTRKFREILGRKSGSNAFCEGVVVARGPDSPATGSRGSGPRHADIRKSGGGMTKFGTGGAEAKNTRSSWETLLQPCKAQHIWKRNEAGTIYCADCGNQTLGGVPRPKQSSHHGVRVGDPVHAGHHLPMVTALPNSKQCAVTDSISGPTSRNDA